jgi:hypothetical protein
MKSLAGSKQMTDAKAQAVGNTAWFHSFGYSFYYYGYFP